MFSGALGRCAKADNVQDSARTAVKRRRMTGDSKTLAPKPWISGIAPYVPGKSAGADGRPQRERGGT